MRRTKALQLNRTTKNLRVVELLHGHTKLARTVRYLGIEVDDTLEMAEQTEAQAEVARGRPAQWAPRGQQRTRCCTSCNS